MSDVGIAVSREYQYGLEKLGFKCSELLPEQSNLKPEDAARLVYVHTNGTDDIRNVSKVMAVFRAVKATGGNFDSILDEVMSERNGTRLE